jgi:DNA-directed RNA polymerase subunit RPC12/RpoP
MSQPTTGTPFNVVCPHCKKEFEAPLLADAAHRQQGFKCPHCRLFVSYERADDQNRVEAIE